MVVWFNPTNLVEKERIYNFFHGGPLLTLIRLRADRFWEYINRSERHECEHCKTEHNYSVFEKTQFHFWEYINRNQTFILDSHRPFIGGAYLWAGFLDVDIFS